MDSLTSAQLDTPSLCGAWTVREVAGHLVSPLVSPPWRLLPLLVGAGFRPHVANARLARQVARRPPAQLAAALREHAEHRFRPPVVGWHGQLTDLQVHGQDIRRPLGLPADGRFMLPSLAVASASALVRLTSCGAPVSEAAGPVSCGIKCGGICRGRPRTGV
ncbi:maleylpyruvate isomerase family mycothiol-dependent enzyme [Micromonospora sp. NPDC018662]|uniref:maleylpyruvate isomerase family mycothiol-dependent enzyme n=1 Tax=Micromonospora sp. NPDC018662 TaxID=3364238 RepID=UPI0037AF5B95